MIQIAIKLARVTLLAIMAFALTASASSLTGDPDFVPPPGGTFNHSNGDREGLVNDGSFEFGECSSGSAWTCTSNTSCEWIIDPTGPWGAPAYDGTLSAWLGGFCGGSPNENSFCQNIFFDAQFLDWYWMGYVNDICGIAEVHIDGDLIYDHPMTPADHTVGTWNSASGTIAGPEGVDVLPYYGGTHELCFVWNQSQCDPDLNDNMLIDYVTLHGSTLESATVNPDGSGDFPTIQEAIDAIAPGGTIFLGDGTFTGPGNYSLSTLGKDFELRSLNLNPENCIIDCQAIPPMPQGRRAQDPLQTPPSTLFSAGDRIPEPVAMYIVSGEGPDCQIRAIKFINCYHMSWYGGAIYIYQSAPSIIDCIFENNETFWGGGAIAAELSSPTIEGCRFAGNYADWGGAVEILGPGSNAEIEGCLFLENQSSMDGGALNIFDGANVDLRYCTFLRNSSFEGGAVSLYENSYGDFRYCSFSENSAEDGGAIWNSVPYRSWFNVISYSGNGAALYWSGDGDLPEFACTNIFANTEGDWTDGFAALLGTDGNISVDPQYCGIIGSDNLMLQSDSPCLPGNNDCGQQLGAFGQGCGESAARITSWSQVKALY